MTNRTIINTKTANFSVYQEEGPVQDDMSILHLSYDKNTGQGAYMMRMQPGSITIPHTHERREEYFIIEGDLIEDDGTKLGPGDYIIYEPGTYHNSRTENGCVLIGIDWSWSE